MHLILMKLGTLKSRRYEISLMRFVSYLLHNKDQERSFKHCNERLRAEAYSEE